MTALWINDYGDANINVSYTFGLDSLEPYTGILMVSPLETAYAQDGTGGPPILAGLRQALETTGNVPTGGSCGAPASVQLPGAIANAALAAQAHPVPTLGGGDLRCVVDTIPSDDAIANDPNIPFQSKYCPVAPIMKIAIGSGMGHLNIPANYLAPLEDTLLQTYGDSGQYWSNFRCNFHPTYASVPTCEVMARAARQVTYPDEVELVWFDREDNGGLSDFSSPALFSDGTLQNTEGFALFVALNEVATGPNPNVSGLCALQPYGVSAPVYRRYAHDEIPEPTSGGCPLGVSCGGAL
jgi:hypothetical protein